MEYFADQIVRHQISVSGGIHPNSLFWVLEKIVTKFSDNFFKAWLSIAGKRSQETSVPRWDDIEKMRDLSFPDMAFKYAQKKNGSLSSVEIYHLALKQSVNQYNCPNHKQESIPIYVFIYNSENCNVSHEQTR